MQSDCYKFKQFQTVVTKQNINILYINHKEPQVAKPSWGCLLCVARQSGYCHQSRDGSEAVWMAHVSWQFGPGIRPTYDQGVLKGSRIVDHVGWWLYVINPNLVTSSGETHLLLFSQVWRCPNTCRRGLKENHAKCSKYCWSSASIKAHTLFHRWCLLLFMSCFFFPHFDNWSLPLTNCWSTAVGWLLRLLWPMAHSGRCAAAVVISRRSVERLGAPVVSYENETLFRWNNLDPKDHVDFFDPNFNSLSRNQNFQNQNMGGYVDAPWITTVA